MPSIQEHDDHAEQYRPYGPDDEATEGPWFVIEPAQIMRLVDIAGDHDGSVRVEYRGRGFWQVFRLDEEGEAIDDGQQIHADEV
jgi:hypothetical protein